MKRIALFVVTAGVLVVATACGSEPAEHQTKSESAAPTRAATSQSASPSPTTEPSPALPTDDTPEDAADGTDINACYDGECEVMVTAPMVIEFDPKTRVEGLAITEIEKDSITIGTSLGEIQAGLKSCNALNEVGFNLRSVDGDTAVIAFFPAVDCSPGS